MAEVIFTPKVRLAARLDSRKAKKPDSAYEMAATPTPQAIAVAPSTWNLIGMAINTNETAATRSPEAITN